MFATLIRRSAREPLSKVTSQASGASSTLSSAFANTNPIKARKVWPPNLEELSPQQQLRFEKKYKRRVVLAQRAPRWQKAVKYAQFMTLTGEHYENRKGHGPLRVQYKMNTFANEVAFACCSCNGIPAVLRRVRMVRQEIRAS